MITIKNESQTKNPNVENTYVLKINQQVFTRFKHRPGKGLTMLLHKATHAVAQEFRKRDETDQ